ncbi:hypothetical protein D3C71_1418570 [compost metagenome]
MWIGGGIGMTMVIAMMRGPPQRAALHAGGADQREDELHGARRLEGAVGEVAVVEGRDRKHAHRVQRGRHADRNPGHTHPDHRHAGQMHRRERDGPHPVHALWLVRRGHGIGAGIEPTPQRGPAASLCGASCVGGGADRHDSLLLRRYQEIREPTAFGCTDPEKNRESVRLQVGDVALGDDRAGRNALRRTG